MEMDTTIFDFNNEEKQFFSEYIDDDIQLNIGRLNSFSAILYFTNEINKILAIPNSIKIYEYEYKKKYHKSLIQSFVNTQTFLLNWNKNYIIEYNDTVLNIQSNRSWDISLCSN